MWFSDCQYRFYTSKSIGSLMCTNWYLLLGGLELAVKRWEYSHICTKSHCFLKGCIHILLSLVNDFCTCFSDLFRDDELSPLQLIFVVSFYVVRLNQCLRLVQGWVSCLGLGVLSTDYMWMSLVRSWLFSDYRWFMSVIFDFHKTFCYKLCRYVFRYEWFHIFHVVTFYIWLYGCGFLIAEIHIVACDCFQLLYFNLCR